ncbi:uncharacterized protein DSM5745_06198 [Aspergillus mulundensis]|uniref:Protein kinase domain-containing protein n=1 Tax=Aspergillus mulundensis TaxID=1810919 RepID=A0A3D8RZ86_9EURO|nr:hypothetical protein DSM5745_06198 [Aspergillus mulundensis]RDW79346.1 hypothetical protein DSM5745_06198 [Aspergillus mulundensis]
MTTSLCLGQAVRGQKGVYTIVRHLQDTVYLARNAKDETVILKSVNHFRLQNERDVLRRFQSRTPFIRPIIDEIVEPSHPPTLVLKHLDDHLLHASIAQRLTRQEVKYVAKGVLEALKVLHQANYVHTDIKPDNVLVNYGADDVRFADVQLADCGSTVPADSGHARDGDLIGAPIWRSPEAQLRIGWGPPTDIWSFGAMARRPRRSRGVRIQNPPEAMRVLWALPFDISRDLPRGDPRFAGVYHAEYPTREKETVLTYLSGGTMQGGPRLHTKDHEARSKGQAVCHGALRRYMAHQLWCY